MDACTGARNSGRIGFMLHEGSRWKELIMRPRSGHRGVPTLAIAASRDGSSFVRKLTAWTLLTRLRSGEGTPSLFPSLLRSDEPGAPPPAAALEVSRPGASERKKSHHGPQQSPKSASPVSTRKCGAWSALSTGSGVSPPGKADRPRSGVLTRHEPGSSPAPCSGTCIHPPPGAAPVCCRHPRGSSRPRSLR